MLRMLAGDRWWQQHAAVTRLLTVMPGLRMAGDSDMVFGDLIAVRSYLTLNDGPLSCDWLAQLLAARPADAHSYLACLASGLRRLPSHRGVVVRDAGALPLQGRTFSAGSELHVIGPLATYELTHAPPSGAHRFLIWSVTGRRVRDMYPAAMADGAEEVVFAPGTGFRVLGIRGDADATTVLLREVTDREASARAGEQEALDRSTLVQLSQAAGRSPAAATATDVWPPRLSGTPSEWLPGFETCD